MTPRARSRNEGRPRFPIERCRLANGLQIVVQPDDRCPLVASAVCYAAGSRNDPASRSGLAHLAEHLAFDGPRSEGGRTFSQRIEISGGTAQATTTADRLCFSAVFPRRELATVLTVEAERMAWPLEPRDIEALEIQRRVLLEELHHRSLSRLRAAAFEQLHRCLYPEGHPYRRPPVGEPDGIRAVTANDLEAFTVSHLTPGNAVVVLAGDVSPRTAFELAARAFEAIPAGARDSRQVSADETTAETHPQPVRVSTADATGYTHVAWSVAGSGREEWHIASLLLRGLTAGRSSPLARELVDRAGLAQEVRGSLITMRDSSTLVFAAAAAPGVSADRLEQGLGEASDRLLSAGLSAAGLARARNKALTDHYCAVESLERRADLCAALACYLDAPDRLEGEPLRYLKPDREAIAAFASWLRRKARATLSLVPATEAA